jgi:hypothetical protein
LYLEAHILANLLVADASAEPFDAT